MDVIEVSSGNSPIFFVSIVDEKLYILRNGSWLDGREVGSLDGGGRVGITHFYGPGTGASADVEDVLWRKEGCIVQFVVEEAFEKVVLVVKTISLGGIVGEVIC